MLQRLINARKEGRIVVSLARADGVCFVVQVLIFQVGVNGPLIGGIQTQIEYLGDAMIDPDDSVVVNGHGFSLC